MAQQKTTVAPPIWRELFQSGVYKRSQGRIARQVTFAAIAIAIALGSYALHRGLISQEAPIKFGVPLAIVAIGAWVAFRAVNVPVFADFLIAVEAEMNKVTWPTRTLLIRSSLVVIFVVFAFSALLFLFDLVWSSLFRFLFDAL